MEDEIMERVRNLVVGALRQTISTHGPITGERIGSATKRIMGSISKYLVKETNKPIITEEDENESERPRNSNSKRRHR